MTLVRLLAAGAAIASYEKSISMNPKNEDGLEALRELKSEAPAERQKQRARSEAPRARWLEPVRE